MLCAKVGNMAWTVDFDSPRVSCQDMSFHMYKPRMWYHANTVPLTYSEGLPKNCIKCHYHKRCRTK